MLTIPLSVHGNLHPMNRALRRFYMIFALTEERVRAKGTSSPPSLTESFCRRYSGNQKDQAHHQEEEEEELGDSRSRSSDTEAKKRRHQRDYQEDPKITSFTSFKQITPIDCCACLLPNKSEDCCEYVFRSLCARTRSYQRYPMVR